MDSYSEIKLCEKVLSNHDYNYSRIYQRFTRGMIRVQYDFRCNIEKLTSTQRGQILATRSILKGYGIVALIEVTNENGTPRVLFEDDFEKMKNCEIVIWVEAFKALEEQAWREHTHQMILLAR